MTGRTVGIEEELALVDPSSRRVSPRSSDVVRAFREQQGAAYGAAEDLDQELYLHQLETRTDPVADLADAADQLRRARRTAGEAAAAAGCAVIATGSVPLSGTADPQVTPNDRYRDMLARFGEVARGADTCAMHVHVSVESDDEGVAVIDRMAPWLPLLVALAANSPMAYDRDTGYASWRQQAWGHWPSAGPTEAFGDAATYHEVSERLIASGAARDTGMLYYDARLAARFPTVEVRVCDVMAEPDQAVAVAAIVRALVETTAGQAAEAAPMLRWRAELLRAAQWRAARYGLSSTLLDPRTGDLVPAREALETLLDEIGPALTAHGDAERADDAVERLLAETGATLQRRALEQTGSIEDVVDDLVRRTEESWTAR